MRHGQQVSVALATLIDPSVCVLAYVGARSCGTSVQPVPMGNGTPCRHPPVSENDYIDRRIREAVFPAAQAVESVHPRYTAGVLLQSDRL
eukprot:scaffold7351_cov259-Pinguiococcus_pyrenoidosus.AAC.20